MPTIEPVGASSKINMLIHGDIGCGKTSLIGSGGKDYKTLIIRTPVDHTDPIIGSGCQQTTITSHEDLFETLEYLRHEGDQWDWVWVDSISLLQDIGLDDVYTTMLDSKGPVGSQARAHRERFGPDKGEYRINMWRLEQFVRYAVGARMFNLGITAHSFWYEPQDSEIPAALWPWVQGKMMPQKICGMMNVVGFMEVRTKEVRGEKRNIRQIRTNKTEEFYAKCQFKLPDARGQFKMDGPSVFGNNGTMVNPTMPKVVEAISKGRVVAEDAEQPRRRRTRQAAAPVRRRTRRERSTK